jgi:putative membrane protein
VASRRSAPLNAVSIFAALAGLAVCTGLIAHIGPAAVMSALVAVGGAGFAAVCAIQTALIAVMGLAWWVLVPRSWPWAQIWARLVRDSASEVLPLSQLGGYVLGARALAITGTPAELAAASTIVDVTLEFFAQLVFIAVALLWLLHADPGARIAWPAALGLAVGLILATGFLIVQRAGFGILEKLASAVGRGWAESTASGSAALHGAIATIYHRNLAIWTSLALHLGCWVAGAAEVWLALRLIGEPRSFGVVLVIESLVYGARSVLFAVPNAAGVQEGAYLMLGAGFGLPAETALALSLLKRARDFTIGLPTLGAYQIVESRLLLRPDADRGLRFGAKRNPGRDDRGFNKPAPEEKAGPRAPFKRTIRETGRCRRIVQRFRKSCNKYPQL